jgi:hypothetical protein
MNKKSHKPMTRDFFWGEISMKMQITKEYYRVFWRVHDLFLFVSFPELE